MSKVLLLVALILSVSSAFVPAATTGRRQTAQPALGAFFTKDPKPTASGTRAVGPPKKKRPEVVAVADKPPAVSAKKPAFSFNMKPASATTKAVKKPTTEKPVAVKKPAFSFSMKPAASTKAAPAQKPAAVKKPAFSFNMKSAAPKATPAKKPIAKKPVAKKDDAKKIVVTKKPANKMAPVLSVFNKRMTNKKAAVVKIPSNLMSATRTNNFLDPSDTFDPGAAEVQNKFDDAMWIEEDTSGSRFWAR